jgi:thioesterase domain-containing protein
VYAVTGHNGDVFSYRDIARSLGEEQPFFALRPPGLDGRSAPRARVDELAAYFAAQIRAFQPSGPLIIAGYCAGGAVAYELARQLAAAGTEPQVVILFGCAHPRFYRFSLPYWGERVALHARTVAQLPSFGERWRYLAERLRQRIKVLRDERTPPGTDPASLTKFRFERMTVAAVRRYTPQPYTGRVCLLIPKRGWLRENGGADLWHLGAPRTEEYYGPDSVDAERMLLDPDAAVFADLFRRCLA